MADAEIRIRVTTDDTDVKKATAATKQFATEIKAAEYQFRQGKLSADQYAKAMSDVANRANAMNLTFKNTVDLNATLYQSQQRVSVGWKSMATSLNDMHTTMKGKATPSVLEFSRIIQDAPYGIRGVANNIQQLSTNFVYLQKEAGGTVPAIKAMLSTMLTGPLAVMFAVSVVTSLAVAFGDKLWGGAKKANAELDKTADNLKRIKELQFELGETTSKNRRGELELSLWEAQTAFDRSTQGERSSAMKELRKTYGPNVSLAGYEFGAGSAELLALKEAQKALADFDKKTAEEKLSTEKKITDELKKQNAEYLSRLKDEAAGYTSQGALARIEAKYGLNSARAGTESLRQGAISNLYGIKPITRLAGGGRGPNISLGDYLTASMTEFGGFQSAFMSGISQISQGISSRIGGAFAGVFGGAKTLLGSFVQAFTQALTELAMKAAAMWVFNLILPGSGTIGGSISSALTGNNSVVGANSVSISNMAVSQGRSRGGTIVPTQMETRISGNDIVVVHRLAMQERAGRVG
jgi:hypothetical protein